MAVSEFDFDTRRWRHAPRTQVWEEVEAAARTEIGAKKMKRLGEPKRTARKTWRAPNLQEEVEDMALVFRDLEEDFDKMRRRQHDLGVSHGPVCQVSETVEVSRVPAVLRDAALEDLFHEVCLRHQSRGGGKGPALRKKSGVTVGLPREFTMADANKILGLHNTKVKRLNISNLNYVYLDGCLVFFWFYFFTHMLLVKFTNVVHGFHLMKWK